MNEHHPTSSGRRPAGALARLLFASIAVAACTEAAIAVRAGLPRGGPLLFLGAALLSNAVLLHLPAIGLAGLRRLLLGGAGARASGPRAWIARGLAATVLVWCLGVALILFADLRVFALYGFHINGFVWNLVFTPGGIESLGAERATWVTTGGLCLLYSLLFAALVVAARWSAARNRPRFRLSPVLAVACLALVAAERTAYAVGHARGRKAIVMAVDVIPFYTPVTARGLASRFGLVAPAQNDLDAVSRLDYPKEPLTVDPAARDLDVVWLVSESLRGDMLDPEIMPATWAFSQQAARFEHHTSGGNGTRMGMFSQFYGVPGTYWFSFLNERRGPVLLEQLLDRGYDVHLSTSAKFTYPEFDQTIFADMPRSELVEFGEGHGYERDRAAVDAIVTYLEQPSSTPRFVFHFFEGPHAPYTFPPEAAIRRPYPKEVDYASLDPAAERDGLFNRYANACHCLDGQLERVMEALERTGALERSIVVITGDHGEEFMEHGHWGHGSSFAKEQVSVPLVVRIPGRDPLVATWRTSHVDLVPTLLTALGVRNDTRTYSTGEDLWTEDRDRCVVISDWSRVAFCDGRFKEVMPSSLAGLFRSEQLTAGDQPCASQDFEAWSRARLPLLLEQLTRFRARGSP